MANGLVLEMSGGCRWKQWKQKCQDDSETKHWLTANTKPCPKCGKPVEKNGGCNLVTCHCGQVVNTQSCSLSLQELQPFLPSAVWIDQQEV